MSESLIEELSKAAKTNDVALLTKLLTDPCSQQIIRKNYQKNSPLVCAIKHRANEATILLLEAKANPNQRTSLTYPPLLLIAGQWNCEFDIMKRLLEAKADVNNQTFESPTALSLAINHQASVRHVQELLSKKANPMLKGSDGLLAIDHALENENPAAVKILAEAENCDLNKPGRRGYPALHQSIFLKFPCATMLLLRTGKVDVNQKNEAGDTPLHFVINHIPSDSSESDPHATLVQTLLAFKAKLNVKDDRKRTPLELLPPPAYCNKTELQVRDILLTNMGKQALLAGLWPRTGASSLLSKVSSRSHFDQQVCRPIWASAFGSGRHKGLQNETLEQQVLLQTLQRLTIDLPLTVLCSKSISTPFSLIYTTSEKATAACDRLKEILGPGLVSDHVNLAVEESPQGWVFSISPQQYDKLLILTPAEVSSPVTEPQPSGSVTQHG